MEYFEGLDLSSLAAVGWKLISKSTQDKPEEPDKIQIALAFQSLNVHQCPVCGQSHGASIGASEYISKTATEDEAKAIVGECWASAMGLIIKINRRIARIPQVAKILLEGEPDESAGNKPAAGADGADGISTDDRPDN